MNALRMMILIIGILGGRVSTAPAGDTIRVGSKNFTEQEILGELVAQLLERHTELTVERRLGLGGSGVCHAALVAGELDVYVEYTGTALLNILRAPTRNDPDAVFREVAGYYRSHFALEWLPPIGFNNTYAMSVRPEDAAEHGWTTLSDFARTTGRRGGFPSEFMERPDGYPGLQHTYNLDLADTAELDPGLMYQALAAGQVDLISGFATDGRIAAYGFTVLRDDRSFFPPYYAAPVVRIELLENHPEVREALAVLAGTIDDAAMRQLNFLAEEHKLPPSAIARRWIEARSGETLATPTVSGISTHSAPGVLQFVADRSDTLLRKTTEHMILTFSAVLLAVCIGVPLGVLIYRRRAAASTVLAITEIIQTVPSLAMLAFLFAVYRTLGTLPAVSALILYAFLPIVLNTYIGLKEIRPQFIEAANGIGMSSFQRLRMVELPLAMPTIIAGIRTATVWTVGIATLSTYIGAGGLGDFINRGLARDDARLTLMGAIPAALLAIVLSSMIRLIERRLSKHTR